MDEMNGMEFILNSGRLFIADTFWFTGQYRWLGEKLFDDHKKCAHIDNIVAWWLGWLLMFITFYHRHNNNDDGHHHRDECSTLPSTLSFTWPIIILFIHCSNREKYSGKKNIVLNDGHTMVNIGFFWPVKKLSLFIGFFVKDRWKKEVQCATIGFFFVEVNQKQKWASEKDWEKMCDNVQCVTILDVCPECWINK